MLFHFIYLKTCLLNPSTTVQFYDMNLNKCYLFLCRDNCDRFTHFKLSGFILPCKRLDITTYC